MLATPPAETREWHLCCSRSDPEALKFVIHCLLAFSTMAFCAGMIASNPDGDNVIYWSTFTYVLGWLSPTPEMPRQRAIDSRLQPAQGV